MIREASVAIQKSSLPNGERQKNGKYYIWEGPVSATLAPKVVNRFDSKLSDVT
jgi:hypothetical protein